MIILWSGDWWGPGVGADSQSKGPCSVWGMWLSEVFMGLSRRHWNKGAGGGDTKVGVVSVSRMVNGFCSHGSELWIFSPTQREVSYKIRSRAEHGQLQKQQRQRHLQRRPRVNSDRGERGGIVEARGWGMILGMLPLPSASPLPQWAPPVGISWGWERWAVSCQFLKFQNIGII